MKKLILPCLFFSAALYGANTSYILVLCADNGEEATLIRFELSQPWSSFNNAGISKAVIPPNSANVQTKSYAFCTEALNAVPAGFKKIKTSHSAGTIDTLFSS